MGSEQSLILCTLTSCGSLHEPPSAAKGNLTFRLTSPPSLRLKFEVLSEDLLRLSGACWPVHLAKQRASVSGRGSASKNREVLSQKYAHTCTDTHM